MRATRLADGRSLRLFSVIDDYNRESLGIEIGFWLPPNMGGLPLQRRRWRSLCMMRGSLAFIIIGEALINYFSVVPAQAATQ